MKNFFSAKNLAKMGIFSALAAILYFVRIPLPYLFPSFLELHISDLPALICGFSLGPIQGCIVIIIKTLIKLLIDPSLGCVGELSDFLNGVAFVLPSALFYRRFRTKKGAAIALLIGSLGSVLSAMFCNRFIIIPLYIRVGTPMETLLNMCSIIPGITADNFYLYYEIFAVIPFNLLRTLLVSLIAFFLYKRISSLINKIG